MSDENAQRGNIYSANDTLDINELASLNDDISPEFIEQLQNQVAQNASEFTGKPVLSTQDDSELFEEISDKTSVKINLDENIDDNFVKKYKAKLNKQQEILNKNEETVQQEQKSVTVKESNEPSLPKQEEKTTDFKPIEELTVPAQEIKAEIKQTPQIENLTSGNISEKPVEQEQIKYNESLDYLDDNVKYSKYVIYIDPENTEFIESLTVKERKNLINRLLREQDDVAITKRRLGVVQTIIKHSIVAIITISIAIPIVYWTINTSLEASINNYRRSQTIFKTLYREKGKIKTQNKY